MEKEQTPLHHKLKVNMGQTERLVSAGAGAWLLYNSTLGSGTFTLNKFLLGSYMLFRGATGHCFLYSVAGKEHYPDPVKNINIRTSITVNKPRHEVYAFWRQLENLPKFMKHLQSVETQDEKRSNWKAEIPGGLGTIEWQAEIVKDDPGQLLGWSSLPGADIENAGKVEFTDAGNGSTLLDVTISYRPPLKNITAPVAKLFNPGFEKMIRKDIENFKTHIESLHGTPADAQFNGRH